MGGASRGVFRLFGLLHRGSRGGDFYGGVPGRGYSRGKVLASWANDTLDHVIATPYFFEDFSQRRIHLYHIRVRVGEVRGLMVVRRGQE